jgi:hypothetical protein
VVELEDDDVALATVNARVVCQVADDPVTDLANRLLASFPRLGDVVGPVVPVVLPNFCPPAGQAAVPTFGELEVGPNLLAGRTDSQRWWQLVHGRNVAIASDSYEPSEDRVTVRRRARAQPVAQALADGPRSLPVTFAESDLGIFR